MRIASIRIQKFRSIDDITISIDQVMALVGANNTGKSHVLRALNAFFNFEDERQSFINRDHQYSAHSRPRISITFSDIQEGSIPDQYLADGQLTIQFTYRWDRRSPSYEVHKGNEKLVIDLDEFIRLTQEFKYIHVPIVRDYRTSFSRDNGIAYQLLSKTIQQHIANRNTIQPHVDNLYNKIQNTVFRNALNNMNEFYPFLNNATFKLEFRDADPIDYILRNIALTLIEDTQENEIGNCGSGVQSAVYFAISLANEMTGGGNYLVGIEEPEQNMHPQAQRQLIDSLKNPNKYPNTQFILTTHSPVIIDKLGHSAVALCRKEKRKTRDIVTTITQIDDGFWDKYGMNEEKYRSYFLYRNSDFFFSSGIIITESSVDCEVIRCLLESYDINPDDLGISFFAADGEKNVRYPYALAKELGIPFICIVDRDTFQPYIGANRKESLDTNGIPKYKNELKTSSPICSVLTDEVRARLNTFLTSNDIASVQRILLDYNIVVMKYALEVDLAICSSYCSAYCDYLAIQDPVRTSSNLLLNYGNRIKGYDVMKAILTVVPKRNLPASYKCMIRELKSLIVKI